MEALARLETEPFARREKGSRVRFSKTELLRDDDCAEEPAEAVALVQVAALHVTSPADHVVEPPGAVNAAASACTDTFNCLVAVASTMFEMVTAAGDAMVDPVMSLTVNVTPDGKVTRACSLTTAVSTVV